jgi:hypothetical protein
VNAQKILEVLTKYEALLSVKYEPVRIDNVPEDIRHHRDSRLAHVLWMCIQAKTFLTDLSIPAEKVASRREKAFRWLGFIQGALWACDVLTIDQMKDDNKPAEEAFEKGRI